MKKILRVPGYVAFGLLWAICFLALSGYMVYVKIRKTIQGDKWTPTIADEEWRTPD